MAQGQGKPSGKQAEGEEKRMGTDVQVQIFKYNPTTPNMPENGVSI